MVLTAPDGARMVAVAVNEAAGQIGFTPGMTLADIRAACPDIASQPADFAADQKLLKRLLRWAVRYTPHVARTGSDGLYLDISGAAHLFGGEDALLRDLHGRLKRFGFTARLGLADTPGGAWALAHYGGGVMNAPPGALREAVAALPVEALRVSPAMALLAHRLGFKTIGSILTLPRSALAARFGIETTTRLDQLLGAEPDPITPARHRQAWREALGFAEPIGQLEDVTAATRLLLARLCGRLEQAGSGLRRAMLTIERVDHHALSLTVAAVRPGHDADVLLRLFERHLDGIDAGFGIERMMLEAQDVERLKPEQPAFGDNSAATREQAALIDRLVNLLSPEQVIRFAPAQSHIPERCVITHAAAYYAPCKVAPDDTWQNFQTAPSRFGSLRPVRLFKSPQPLKTFSPADPATGFPREIFWQGQRQAIEPVAGYERIMPEWWRDDPAWRSGPRDYRWVASDHGALLWVFRSARPAQDNAWFVHGLGS